MQMLNNTYWITRPGIPKYDVPGDIQNAAHQLPGLKGVATNVFWNNLISRIIIKLIGTA